MSGSMLRITGMASGLDVDAVVKQMMKAHSMKLDKVKQDKQVLQWKQELYRDIIGDLNSFKSTYFDVLKPENYMLSSNIYSGFEVKSSDAANAVVTAVPSTNAVAGNYTVSNVTMATKATYVGNQTTNIERASRAFSSLKIDDSNKTLSFSVTTTNNGKETTNNYTVDVAKGTYSNIDDLTNAIKVELANKDAKDKDGNTIKLDALIDVTNSGDGRIQFQPKDVSVSKVSAYGNNASNNALKFGEVIKTGINDTLTFKVGAVSYNATLDPSTNFDDPAALVSKINSALANAVDKDGNKLPSGEITAQLSLDGTKVQLAAKGNTSVSVTGNALSSLGFSGNPVEINQGGEDAMINLFTNLTDAELKNMSFTVNSTTITYDFSETGAQRNWSISQVLSDISSKAGVAASYNQLTRNFSITSNSTGANQAIDVASSSANGTTFLNTLFGTAPTATAGTDATLTIKDPSSGTATQITKSTNNFTVNGVAYTLTGNTTGDVTFTVNSNTQKTFDKIKGFIDKYNEIVGKISSKIEERKQYSYVPLTDDQKKEMEEKDIEAWEAKAKQGLIKGDNTLENMLSQMRSAFYDAVKPVFSDDPNDKSNIGITLSEIGLSTSSDTLQRGKIIIDESKLKSALETKGDKVAELFMKTSTAQSFYSPTSDTTTRKHRYQEEGIFQRISDILQDNIRTTRDNNSRKGALLEKAGVKGEFSELNNLLTTQINEKDTLINKLVISLQDKENKYYLQFSKLEQVMQNLNSQSNWLTSQLGSMG